jgi:hypothetical protein
MSAPVTNLVSYYPKKGKEKELLALVQKHFPVLKKAGLVGDLPVKIWKATDIRKGGVCFVELFQWKDETSSDVAHQTPEVMAIWEPMGEVLETLTICKAEEMK